MALLATCPTQTRRDWLRAGLEMLQIAASEQLVEPQDAGRDAALAYVLIMDAGCTWHLHRRGEEPVA